MDPGSSETDSMPSFCSHALVYNFLQAAKIVSCGMMVSSAVLFPVASNGNFSFLGLTLGLFVVSAAVYLTINLRSLVKVGPCTVPVALFVLLQAVVSDRSTSSSLIPWLPLGFAFTSITTVAIYTKICKRFKDHISVPPDEKPPHTSLDLRSEISVRSGPDPFDGNPPSESYRQEPEFFQRHGPPSHCTYSSHGGNSGISLSGISGRCQDHWEPLAQSYFVSDYRPESCQGAANVGRRQDDKPLERNSGEAHHSLLDIP
ncbi:hypothetical protein B0T20DRAFT_239694 [Sordaria brevicollis]|uniref:Uncharacterized protein n=1 Tax=Sordaria brevicollis TaxID=83679 RepID=A0AAE0PDZ1_SORBR|nr:hypothetical protein B0T20DRAFT_239694 [Sordaria brevicollis]